MRMWQVNSKWMCHQHLLGEHRELHAITGTLRLHKNIQGYIDNNLIEVKSIIPRHEALIREMTVRGYKHNSPLNQEEIDLSYLPKDHLNYKVNIESSAQDLYNRCAMCRWRSYLFYLAGYNLADPYYHDNVIIFNNTQGIYGLAIRTEKGGIEKYDL